MPRGYYATVTNSGNVDLFDVPALFTAPTGVDVTTIAPEARSADGLRGRLHDQSDAGTVRVSCQPTKPRR